MLRGSHRVLQATLLVLLCLPGLVLVGRICLSSGLPKRARVHHTSGYAKRLDKHRPYLTASVGSEDKQSLLVEFSLRGLTVPLADALDASYALLPEEVRAEQELLSASQGTSYNNVGRDEQPGEGHGSPAWASSYAVTTGPADEDLDVPYKDLRLFIAVTSTCCSATSISAARRRAARSTWVQIVLDSTVNTDVRFVLAQPAPEARAAALRDLTPEVRSNNDLLFVRGAEEYRNLPNKTLRLLLYVLSSRERYTHVLKTDDDCYVRLKPLIATLRRGDAQYAGYGVESGRYRDRGVYTGCLENEHGFYPLRNEDSKWYISQEEMPDEVVPWAHKYLAGWGYLLSADVVLHIVGKYLRWKQHPEEAPGWYPGLHWEDVLIGLMAEGPEGSDPQPSAAFVAAWQGCTPETAVKHLDVEAPGLFQRLYRREVSGTWEGQTVACSAAGARGGFEVGNYWSWKGWRDGLSGVQPLGEVG